MNSFLQSIAFHDNGKKHQEMVELKLKSIRNKGKIEERQAKRADSWVKIMEEKAMKVQDSIQKDCYFFFSERCCLEVKTSNAIFKKTKSYHNHGSEKSDL